MRIESLGLGENSLIPDEIATLQQISCRSSNQLINCSPIEMHWESLLWCILRKRDNSVTSVTAPMQYRCSERDHSILNNRRTTSDADFCQNSLTTH